MVDNTDSKAAKHKARAATKMFAEMFASSKAVLSQTAAHAASGVQKNQKQNWLRQAKPYAGRGKERPSPAEFEHRASKSISWKQMGKRTHSPSAWTFLIVALIPQLFCHHKGVRAKAFCPSTGHLSMLCQCCCPSSNCQSLLQVQQAVF